LAAHEVYKYAEIDAVHDLTVVDLADFGLFDDSSDPLAGRFDLAEVAGRNLDHALVIDVDLRTSCGHDFAAQLAAGAEDVADVRFVDLHRLDARRVSGKLGARRAQRLGHLC